MSGRAAFESALKAAALFSIDASGLGGLVVRARAGPVRAQFLESVKALQPAGAPWLKAPLNADDESLLGGFDLAAALQESAARVRPGLLARADGGMVVIPGAERLNAAQAARIAAVMDEGLVRLEREGAGRTFPSRFGLLVLDEGEGPDEGAPAALKERCAFWVDLSDVALGDCAEGLRAANLEPARRPGRRIAAPTAVIGAIAQASEALDVASPRAGLFALRAARASAQLDGREDISGEDASLAAGLVLGPRARRMPAETQAPPPPDDPMPEDQSADHPPAEESIAPETLADQVIAASLARAPANLLAALAVERTDRARATGHGTGARRRGQARGRPIGVEAGDPTGGRRLALLATLRAAAPWQKLRPRPAHGLLAISRSDLRVRRFAERREASVIFVVDASGSSAVQRLSEVKGAIELVLAEAYAKRTFAALIAFRKDQAEIILPPTRALARARAELAALPGGGATPLAAGLEAGYLLARSEQAKGRTVLLVVMSDGRANIARDGQSGRAGALEDALAVARLFKISAIPAVFVDTARFPAPENQALAEAMGARYQPLPFADAAGLRAAVQA